MTNEEKQLLLTDLCGRLPFKTKVFFSIVYDEPVELSLTILRCLERIPLEQNDIVIKPYLRSMSSMTKEEKDELNSISYEFGFEWIDAETAEEKYIASAKMQSRSIDFYNANHFDYRGLIPMGLALEAPEDMYKTE